MPHLRFSGSPADFAALEDAVTRAVGACRCGPVRRRMGYLCQSCECLASILASTDIHGHATSSVWAEWKRHHEWQKSREPKG